MESVDKANNSVDSQNNVRLWQFGKSVFLRILAAYFLILALRHWGTIVIGTDAANFTTLALPVQISVAVFAVFYPITAFGLWNLFNWGVILWLINSVAILAMHLVFSAQFGEDYMEVSFAISSMLFFAILQVALHLNENNS